MKKCYPALAMCFFILCAVLCSCNTNVGNPSGSDVSFNPDGGFFGLELPDGIDYGGREVRVLTTAVNDDWSYQISPESNPSFSAEDAGTVVSAAAERTRLVEEKLGITITEQVIYSSSRYGGDMYQSIVNGSAAGTNDFLFCMPCTIEAAMLAGEGLLRDLNGIDTLDLSREWWSRSFNDTVSIAGSVYFAVGDIGYVNKNATLFIAFNKQLEEDNHLAEDYGYSSLYDMVDDMAWTQDVLFSMAKSVYQDLNENNACDVGDMLGLSGQDTSLRWLVMAGGETIVAADSEGYPSLSIYNERAINLITDAQEYFQSGDSGFISANDYFGVSNIPVTDVIVPEFKANKCMFFMDAVLNMSLLRDMETDFGVLPMPMYDKEQGKYISLIGAWSCDCVCVTIDVTGEDLELVGYLLDSLGAVSRALLNEAYYEQTLQYQISRDDDSMRMLDIIFANRTPELAEIYRWGKMADVVAGMYKAPIGSFASAYETAEQTTKKDIDETVEIFKNLQRKK